MDLAASQGVYISQQLLLSIAQQMKMPLMQISRQAELANYGVTPQLDQIQAIADNALQLIDSYSLGLQLSRHLGYELVPETVSAASVLYDASLQLKAIAKLYDVQLDLNISGRFEPVLAHRKGLK